MALEGMPFKSGGFALLPPVAGSLKDHPQGAQCSCQYALLAPPPPQVWTSPGTDSYNEGALPNTEPLTLLSHSLWPVLTKQVGQAEGLRERT